MKLDGLDRLTYGGAVTLYALAWVLVATHQQFGLALFLDAVFLAVWLCQLGRARETETEAEQS